MSYRLTSLILRMAQCPCPQKIVLAVIADMADDDGMCWPSLETIALRAPAAQSLTKWKNWKLRAYFPCLAAVVQTSIKSFFLVNHVHR